MKVTGRSIEQLDKSKPRGKCRKWRLWLSTDEGRKSRRFEGTWTEAQDALRAFEEEIVGKLPDAGTFGSYAASWRLWRIESGQYAPGTLANDERHEKAFAKTDLWDMELGDVAPGDCRDVLSWLRNHPDRGGEPLTGTTMAKMHSYAYSVLGQAHRDGLIASNPMDAVKPPKVDTGEKRALTREEVNEVLSKLAERPPDAHVMAVQLMLLLGLRRGEALALLDSDVTDVVRIDKAVKERDGSVGAPKSKAGVRTLPMPWQLREAVGRWREVRESRGHGPGPFCCNIHGEVMRPQNLYKWWDAHRAEFGCDGMTMHELRHTNLTIVARHMSPFDLQRYAGWSSIAPARIYIHDDADSVAVAVRNAWE